MAKIYRVIHKDNHDGFYMSLRATDVRAEYEIFWYGQNRPGPNRETIEFYEFWRGLNNEIIMSGKYKFGFDNKSDLVHWFYVNDKITDLLHEDGYIIAVFEGDIAIRGNNQCLFHKDKVQLIETLPIKQLKVMSKEMQP